jgi:hypothetical protein
MYVNFRKVGDYRLNSTTLYAYGLVLQDTNIVQVSKWLALNPSFKLIDSYKNRSGEALFFVSEDEPESCD